MQLVERDAFLAQLRSYAAEVREGQSRLVLVSGEAGVGKTALVEAFEQTTAGQDVRFLWSACDGLATPRPLSPLFDLAAQLGGELQRTCTGGAGRDQLFAALLDQLLALDGCTVLVVEDLHWADEATADLLRFLARRLTRSRVMLVVTLREVGLAPTHVARVALGDTATMRGTRRITLPTLTPSAVADLAAGSPYSADALYALTGGNPFFVFEVLRGDGETLPPSARDAVLAQAARLGPEGRRTLEAATVLGTRHESDLLLALPGASQAGLAECTDLGLLVRQGSVLQFRHHLSRLAVAEALPAARTTELHRAALDLLVSKDSCDAARLAHHAEGAADAAAVRRFATLAAEQAAALSAHREALAHYQRAERFAGSLAADDAAGLFDSLADEAGYVDEWEACRAARREAIERWRRVGDVRRLGDALRKQSIAQWRLCSGEESLACAQEAVDLLQDGPDCRELGWALATCVKVSLPAPPGGGQLLARLGRAERIARGLGDGALLSDVLNTKTWFLPPDADADVWRPLLREAIEVALEVDAGAEVARGYSNLHALLIDRRHLTESGEVFEEAVTYCDEHDMDTYAVCLRGARAHALGFLGRHEEGSALAAAILERGVPSPVNSLNPLSALGLLNARAGRPEVWEHLDRALETAQGNGEPGWQLVVRVARAEAHWLAGRDGAAATEVVPLLTLALDPWERGRAVVWAHRLGVPVPPDAGDASGPLPAPYAEEVAGRHRAAALLWDGLESPYDAVLALVLSDDPVDVREGHDRAVRLGVAGAAAQARRRLRSLGADQVPAGPRPSTRSHALGLTRRESEVLELLARDLSNADIAASLVLSERTVDHHVSAILRKLEVPTRHQAAERWSELGGPARAPART